MRGGFWLILFLVVFPGLGAQEVLRGEVRIDLEPVYGTLVEHPLDAETAQRRALEKAALFYSAMIYGWSFYYDVGERARGIAEEFELEALGTIPFGDPQLYATDGQVRDMRLYLWTDYRLSETQRRRVGAWRTGTIRSAQATGYGPLEGPDWLAVNKAALEDAARAAVRAILRGDERNRPKEVRGLISLSAFPEYFMSSGRWAVSARFLVEIKDIVPFAAY